LETENATVHHFMICFHRSGSENTTKKEWKSYCVVSDHLELAATMVHPFMRCVLHHLVHCFSTLEEGMLWVFQ
jgi:hypothetical protein